MKPLHFQSTIRTRDHNPYILITKAQVEKLKPSWKKPIPVLVQINGQPEKPWRINMMPVGNGSFYLYLHGDVRKASNAEVNDVVTVDVSFDDEYEAGPQHEMPQWFSEALDNNEVAKANWEKLIPSRKKEVLRYFSSLKSQEVMFRNLGKVMDVLSGNLGHFMARDWSNGV